MQRAITHTTLLFSLPALLASGPLLAQQGADDAEEITVLGRQEFLETRFTRDRSGSSTDVSNLMEEIPGGGANANGPLTGQIQYRGMSGPRINVRVDGMLIHGGGPNWMAPPLHHIPAGLMEELTVEKGIASISTGGGIGGAATAYWKKPDFGLSEDWEWSGDIETGFSTTDHGTSSAIMAGLSSDSQRFFVMGSHDQGDDYDSGGEPVDATQYQRDAYGFGYGLRQGDHQLDFDFRRLETGETGTPSLPMDIEWFDTDLWNLSYSTSLGGAGLELRVYGSDISHGMSNHTLRPAPDFSSLPLPPFQGDDKRFVTATSEEAGYKLTLDMALAGGTLEAGLEGKMAEHDATVTDPDFAPFFVENFKDNEVDDTSVFGQWSAMLSQDWYFEAGASVHRVETSAGAVDGFPAQLVDNDPDAWPMGTPPRAFWMLREGFNNSDRSQDDTNLDWVIKGRYQAYDNLVVELGAAQKMRSPMYQERYLWVPLETNAGLGDGNNYVGDPELDPERSRQVELGLDWTPGNLSISPRFYYRHVDDYIQGVPATEMAVVGVSGNANGDPTPLRFANTEARFWGADIGFGVPLPGNWRIDGQASMVRAERDDISDNLYRTAPDSLRATLSYNRGSLSLRLQQVLNASQDRLSATNTRDPQNPSNSFDETPGYGLTNLYLDWFVNNSLSVTAGVENLGDREYTDHLTGFNRVIGSQVPVGDRLPGQGRSLFGRVQYRW